MQEREPGEVNQEDVNFRAPEQPSPTMSVEEVYRHLSPEKREELHRRMEETTKKLEETKAEEAAQQEDLPESRVTPMPAEGHGRIYHGIPGAEPTEAPKQAIPMPAQGSGEIYQGIHPVEEKSKAKDSATVPPKGKAVPMPAPGSGEIYHGIRTNEEQPRKTEPVSVGQYWKIEGLTREILEIDEKRGIAIVATTQDELKRQQEKIQKSGKPVIGAGSNKAYRLADLERLGKRAA